MLKKIIGRALCGTAFGVLSGQITTICISAAIGKGSYIPVTYAFASRFDNEITAVIVQLLLEALIGAIFSGSSVIFEVDKWSILKQYGMHFVITSVMWVFVVYMLWMPENIRGVISTLITFLATYIIVWVTQYMIYKKDIKNLNKKIIEMENDNQ